MKQTTIYFVAILITSMCFIRCVTPDNNAVIIEQYAVHKSDTITIHQMQFDPAEINVKAGDTVVWKNDDIVTHNVTEENAKEWSSPALTRGQTWKMVVNKSATYYCSFHPIMKGKLILK